MQNYAFFQAREHPYDLAIIGGGINGAAIARDAALRGLDVILFEKHDFAYGASSKSSKLAHGGLRYLEQFQFNLVRSSLKERALLLKNAPHQVKLIPFVFPVYAHHSHPLWMVRLGLKIYDYLTPPGNPSHFTLSRNDIAHLFPHMTQNQLKGGCLYFDAQMLDNRLVMSNLLSAQANGAHLHNYKEVVGLSKASGMIDGVILKDELAQTLQICKAKTVINVTGAWSNHFLKMEPSRASVEVYPTKGVHLVIPQVHPTHALALTAPQDQRIFFLIPWEGFSLLGTTDTPFQGPPEDVRVEKEDIDYLIKAFHVYFPGIELDERSIISSFAALRPLVNNHETTAYDMMRDHVLQQSPSGLITMLGGKFTTHRQMAEQAVNMALSSQGQKKRCLTEDTPLFNANDLSWMTASEDQLVPLASKYRITTTQLLHLIRNYGSHVWKIFSIIKDSPEEAKQICPHHPHLFAELTYAIHNEYVRTPTDWTDRRTTIRYICKGMKCIDAIQTKFNQLAKSDKHIGDPIPNF
jgi:glycerol-3-phosphate dehydrogenase